MRTKTSLIVFLVAALVGASAVAWHQWQELATLRAAALAGDERAALEGRLAEFRRRNYELQAQLAALQAEKRPPASAAGDAKKKPGVESKAEEQAWLARLADLRKDAAAGAKRDEDLELLAAMADLPEFQRLIGLQQRGKVDEKYGALFRKLKMTPEELTRLQILLADRQGAYADALLAARNQGLTGKDARDVATKVTRDTQKEINTNIKDLLGPQRFSQFQNFERTAPQRETVDQLAQRLSYTSTPLTSRQSDQLVQALATGGKPIVTPAKGGKPAVTTPQPTGTIAALPGSVAGLGLGASSSVAISNPVVAAAQRFLAPQQLTALQRMQQEQQAQQTLGNLLRTGTVNAPPKRPGPVKPPAPKPGK